MPGLPLGASRQHDVDASLLDYEHIAGIEFIEIDPDRPYARSAAYRPCAGGAEMRLRDYEPDVEDVALDEDEARAYLSALVAAGLFAWRRVYRPSQGTFVNVADEWRVEVTFSGGDGAKPPRPFKVEGEGVFPENYEKVSSLLMRGRTKGPDRGGGKPAEGEPAGSDEGE